MLDQVLDCFDVSPDHDLNLMTPDQTLAQITGRVLTGLDPILVAERPAMAVVQGDTTTTMAAALAAFYRGIPVAHVEAGLRTGDLARPFPEELNRVVTGRLADLHFAPTERARCNLLAEGITADRIFVTGNSGIDALFHVVAGLEQGRLADQRMAVDRSHAETRSGDGAPAGEFRRGNRADLRAPSRNWRAATIRRSFIPYTAIPRCSDR